MCYSATYATIMQGSSLSSILSSCNKINLLLGCRPIGSVIFTVAAMGNRNDVLYNCGSLSNCSHIANGVGWYYSDSYSWGFVSGGDTVRRSSCDVESTNANYRLCWHTAGSGGYRCGSTTGLSSNASWEKVIYHSNWMEYMTIDQKRSDVSFCFLSKIHDIFYRQKVKRFV